MAIAMDAGELLGQLLESWFFGIYCVLFFPSIYVLLTHNRGNSAAGVNKILLGGNSLLFIITIVHYALGCDLLWDAFINGPKLTPKPRPAGLFYANIANPRDIARTALDVFAISAFDLLLIYRVFIVWRRNWLVITPLLLICAAATAANVYVTIGLSQLKNTAWNFQDVVHNWLPAGYCLSFALSVISVGLVAVRILHRERAVGSAPGTQSLWRVVAILVEGAAGYCIITLLNLACVLTKSHYQATTWTTTPPITGISACLMCLLVGLRKMVPSRQRYISSSGQGISAHATELSNISKQGRHGGSRAVEISIKQEAVTDVDSAQYRGPMENKSEWV